MYIIYICTRKIEEKFRFYAECTEYNDAVGSEAADAENNLFMESPDWINMVASVIARTGVNMNQGQR